MAFSIQDILGTIPRPPTPRPLRSNPVNSVIEPADLGILGKAQRSLRLAQAFQGATDTTKTPSKEILATHKPKKTTTTSTSTPASADSFKNSRHLKGVWKGDPALSKLKRSPFEMYLDGSAIHDPTLRNVRPLDALDSGWISAEEYRQITGRTAPAKYLLMEQEEIAPETLDDRFVVGTQAHRNSINPQLHDGRKASEVDSGFRVSDVEARLDEIESEGFSADAGGSTGSGDNPFGYQGNEVYDEDTTPKLAGEVEEDWLDNIPEPQLAFAYREPYDWMEIVLRQNGLSPADGGLGEYLIKNSPMFWTLYNQAMSDIPGEAGGDPAGFVPFLDGVVKEMVTPSGDANDAVWEQMRNATSQQIAAFMGDVQGGYVNEVEAAAEQAVGDEDYKTTPASVIFEMLIKPHLFASGDYGSSEADIEASFNYIYDDWEKQSFYDTGNPVPDSAAFIHFLRTNPQFIQSIVEGSY